MNNAQIYFLNHRFIVRFPMGLEFILGSVNEEYWSSFLMTECPSWRQPHAWNAISNSFKYNILDRTQLIQLYKFVCTIPTQNSNINLHHKQLFSRLLRHICFIANNKNLDCMILFVVPGLVPEPTRKVSQDGEDEATAAHFCFKYY